jgi:hypothetical protein
MAYTGVMPRQVSYLEAPLVLWSGDRRGATYECGQTIEATGWYEVRWDDLEHRVTLTPTKNLEDDEYLVWHHSLPVS